MGRVAQPSGVQPKRRQERRFYFKTEAVKRIHSRRALAVCASVGHAECNKIIAMPNGGTQGVLHHFLRCHTALNVTADAFKNPPNFMILLNQGVPEVVHQQTTIMQEHNVFESHLFTNRPVKTIIMQTKCY
jgi:hypothetical protein